MDSHKVGLFMYPHNPVKFHFQESDKPSVLLAVDRMEVQNTLNRIARELENLFGPNTLVRCGFHH